MVHRALASWAARAQQNETPGHSPETFGRPRLGVRCHREQHQSPPALYRGRPAQEPQPRLEACKAGTGKKPGPKSIFLPEGALEASTLAGSRRPAATSRNFPQPRLPPQRSPRPTWA